MYIRESLTYTLKAMIQVVFESSSEEDLQLLLHLADRLNIRHSAYLPVSTLSDDHYSQLRQNILTYSAPDTSSFGDASVWQSQTRDDRPLPGQFQ